MEKTKTIKLINIEGVEVEVVLKTLISAWDDEQIRSAVWNYMEYDEVNKKAKVNFSKSLQFAADKTNKMLSVLVLKFGTVDKPGADFVKQNLDREEFEKLEKELDAIAEPENKKKENLPNNSSSDLASDTPKTQTPVSQPSSPENSQL